MNLPIPIIEKLLAVAPSSALTVDMMTISVGFTALIEAEIQRRCRASAEDFVNVPWLTPQQRAQEVLDHANLLRYYFFEQQYP